MKKIKINEKNKIIRASNKARKKDRVKQKRKNPKKIKTIPNKTRCKMSVHKMKIFKDLIMALKK